jgi:hypothetical protein
MSPPPQRQLAFRFAVCYSVFMVRQSVRRISVLLLALALAFGLATHRTGGHGELLKSSMATAGDVSMPGKCHPCANDQSDMTAACSAFCIGVVAALAMAAVLGVSSFDVLRPSTDQDATGYVGPPDPYPP